MLELLARAIRRLLELLGIAGRAPTPSPPVAPPPPAPPHGGGEGPVHPDSTATTVSTQAMLEIVDITGAAPGTATGEPRNTMAMVHHFAGAFETCGYNADGRALPKATNADLSGALGDAYGADGSGNFNLPDLRGRSAIGVSPGEVGGYDPAKRTLGMVWMICNGGDFPVEKSPALGMLRLMSAEVVPDGWLPADGRMLSKAENPALFDLLGYVYGGDGADQYAVPDLSQRTPVGMGTASDGSVIDLGTKVDGGGGVAGLGLNFLIVAAGNQPASQPGGSFDPITPLVGEVLILATVNPVFNDLGWFPAVGQVMLTAGGLHPLFLAIGSAYGGNGKSTFMLPNLEGKAIVGAATPSA